MRNQGRIPGVGVTAAAVTAEAALRAAGDAALVGVEDVTGASYTLVLADAGKLKRFDRATAQTVTVPPNSSVAYPVGTFIELAQVNAGALTVAAGAGVTINTPTTLAFGTQWQHATLVKTATDRWLLCPSQSGSYAVVVSLGNASGGDDTAALNALLATATGKVARGVPGASYRISAPLIVPTGCTLDMTGCTITLIASSNCNMLNNTGVADARSVIDGAITAAAATLTSATASFTNADIGKAVYVVGADASGARRLISTISSVTNGTTAVLADNAGTSVTGAWVTIGTRDQRINIIGGTWNRGANGASGGLGYTSNSLRLRRVDYLVIKDVKVVGTAGKYGVNPGDVWRCRVSGIENDTFSDGTHVNGPARHLTLRDLHGLSSGDDVVSLTCNDFQTAFSNANMNDSFGDIDDVLIDGVTCEYGTQRGVLLLAGKNAAANLNLSRITVRNVRGHFTSSAVWIGGDPNDPNTLDGIYTTILVDTVQPQHGPGGSNNVVVALYDGTLDNITIRNVSGDPLDTNTVGLVGVGIGSKTPVVGRLLVENPWWTVGNSAAVSGVVYVNRGSIDHLVVRGSQVKTTSTLGVALVRAINGQSVTMTKISLSDCNHEVGSGGSVSSFVADTDTGVSACKFIEMSNMYAKNVTYPLARLGGTTTIKAVNVHMEGASAQIRGEAAAVLTVEADHIDTNTNGVSLAAGGTVRSLSFGFAFDVSTTGVVRNNGDAANNTNAGLACGAGQVVCNGTSWKGLYSGATY